MNMPEFPEDTWVEVRYPPTAGQEHGDREALAVAARLGGQRVRPG